jgi:hypothetical protein
VVCGLDDANLVGDIQCIVVWCQAHVGLLEAIGPAAAAAAAAVVTSQHLTQEQETL